MKNEEKKILISKLLEIYIFINEILYGSELFEKFVGMLDFVILDIVLALNRYCLWAWDYSARALRYTVVFFEKSFCFVVIKYVVFIQMLGFQWLIQAHRYKYKITEDYSVHSVKSVRIRSFFWSVFSRIRTEYDKIRARKSSVFGHFWRSGSWKPNKEWLHIALPCYNEKDLFLYEMVNSG